MRDLTYKEYKELLEGMEIMVVTHVVEYPGGGDEKVLGFCKTYEDICKLLGKRMTEKNINKIKTSVENHGVIDIPEKYQVYGSYHYFQVYKYKL